MNRIVTSNFDPHFKIKLKAASAIASKILQILKYRHTYLSLVFVTDAKIKKINKKFLNHSWATDVLAFPFEKPFLGEVLISPKRAKVQAEHLNVSFKEELARYICHGILHLSGYGDKKPEEQKLMRKKEDFLLNKMRSQIIGLF